MKVSIIITAYKEADSVRKALMRYIPQYIQNTKSSIDVYETLIVAPDVETEKVCHEFREFQNNKPGYKCNEIRYIKDPGIGKPAALNLALKEAKGDVFILTDGDVYPNAYAVRELTRFFEHSQKVGAVSGRPKSISPRTTMLGYWSHVLANMADVTRRRFTKERKPITCSGYLYAVSRRALVEIDEHGKETMLQMPEDILSDDAYVSYIIENRGFKILYSSAAQVFVKYPSTFSDWIKQKARSTGGYVQLEKMGVAPKNKKNIMRGFWQEAKEITTIFKYAKNLKEVAWTGLLVLARMYLWLKIWYERRLNEKSFEETWTRIETTK